MEGGEEEIPGAVAGEELAGTVGSVGGRGEAEDDYPGPRIAETGNGAAPVGLIPVGGLLLAGDSLAPLDEARAAAAGGDRLFQCREPDGCFEAWFGLVSRVQAP